MTSEVTEIGIGRRSPLSDKNTEARVAIERLRSDRAGQEQISEGIYGISERLETSSAEHGVSYRHSSCS